jgi:hypothetical protein
MVTSPAIGGRNSSNRRNDMQTTQDQTYNAALQLVQQIEARIAYGRPILDKSGHRLPDLGAVIQAILDDQVDVCAQTMEAPEETEIKVTISPSCFLCGRGLTLAVYGAPITLAVEIVESAGWKLSPVCVCPRCQNGNPNSSL